MVMFFKNILRDKDVFIWFDCFFLNVRIHRENLRILETISSCICTIWSNQLYRFSNVVKAPVLILKQLSFEYGCMSLIVERKFQKMDIRWLNQNLNFFKMISSSVLSVEFYSSSPLRKLLNHFLQKSVKDGIWNLYVFFLLFWKKIWLLKSLHLTHFRPGFYISRILVENELKVNELQGNWNNLGFLAEI